MVPDDRDPVFSYVSPPSTISGIKVTWWLRMAPKAPAFITSFRQQEEEKGKAPSPPAKEKARAAPMLLLTSHWPELSHMTTPFTKEARKRVVLKWGLCSSK